MSSKNQKTLVISASVIVGLTAAALIGLNFLVDSISQIPQPSLAGGKFPNTTDDQLKKGKQQLDDPNLAPDDGLEMPPPGLKDRPDPMNGRGRVRNGKDDPNLRRAPPPPMGRDDAVPNGQRPKMPEGAPPMPPASRGLTPQEQAEVEEEMERRREMYYGGGGNAPPPGYYPPPPDYEDYGRGYEYDNGYPAEDYNYNDYDYDYFDPDYDGKRPTRNDRKIADERNRNAREEVINELEEVEDDYVDDGYEE